MTAPPLHDKDDEEGEVYGVQGLHGTVAPQLNEDFYDDREDADDDLEKGRLKFPDKMYGREKELALLSGAYENMVAAAEGVAGAGPSSAIFLSGYSGVGKSALVTEFVKRLRTRHHPSRADQGLIFARGKYTQNNSSSAPFSAIIEVFLMLVASLPKKTNDDVPGRGSRSKVWDGIMGSEFIGPGTEGNLILRLTFPALIPLLDSCEDKNEKSGRSHDDERDEEFAASPSMNAIKICILELVSAISKALAQPMILFLDDMQWADDASMETLSFLLSSKTMGPVMFICAFRSNEVDAEHPFAKLMENVTNAREGNSHSVEAMELFSLSPEAVKEFISDSVKKEEAKDVAELAEVVYTKTMGNIFFVMQALEELVRNNVLFYDVMCFEWRWVASRAELANFVSDDVVESVKGKIKQLSNDIQDLLVVMSHIPNSMDAAMLAALMSDDARTFTADEIGHISKEASEEGMLIRSGGSGNYVFGHDRIREASAEVASERSDRDDLMLRISQVLMEMTHGHETEWCLFVAVDLLNSLPPNMVKREGLIKLNMKVSNIAKSRGSLERENGFLYRGLKCLSSSGLMWKGQYYGLTLEVYNAAIESDYRMGHYDKAMVTIENVLHNATSKDDKFTAYLYQMACKNEANINYSQAAIDGVAILNLYGFDIPETISKAHMVKEEMKVKLALRQRSYSSLTDLPLKESPFFLLFEHVERYAFLSGNKRLVKLVAWKSIHFARERGMGRQFPTILGWFAMSLASQDNIELSNEVGHLALALTEKAQIRGDASQYAGVKGMVIGCVLIQLRSFRTYADTLLQVHHQLKMVGSDSNGVLGSMLGYIEVYFGAGLPLGLLFESRICVVEEYCKSVAREGFLMSFQIARQFAMNLRKQTKRPTELCGEAFHEQQVFSMIEGDPLKMATRDSSSKRLQLAFIFGDIDTMHKMLTILQDYPLQDALVSRTHNRVCFMGLAAFALYNETGAETFLKLGKECLKHFGNLTKRGSENAKPVHLFMIAMEDPSQKAFNSAITACSEARMVHLEALANERYASFLSSENNDVALVKDALTTSYWLYQEWGAHAKALQLLKQYPFLKNAKRNISGSISTWSMSEHL